VDFTDVTTHKVIFLEKGVHTTLTTSLIYITSAVLVDAMVYLCVPNFKCLSSSVPEIIALSKILKGLVIMPHIL